MDKRKVVKRVKLLLRKMYTSYELNFSSIEIPANTGMTRPDSVAVFIRYAKPFMNFDDVKISKLRDFRALTKLFNLHLTGSKKRIVIVCFTEDLLEMTDDAFELWVELKD